MRRLLAVTEALAMKKRMTGRKDDRRVLGAMSCRAFRVAVVSALSLWGARRRRALARRRLLPLAARRWRDSFRFLPRIQSNKIPLKPLFPSFSFFPSVFVISFRKRGYEFGPAGPDLRFLYSWHFGGAFDYGTGTCETR